MSDDQNNSTKDMLEMNSPENLINQSQQDHVRFMLEMTKQMNQENERATKAQYDIMKSHIDYIYELRTRNKELADKVFPPGDTDEHN